MNVWQALKQIKYELEQAAWPGGSAGSVFGSVWVTAGPQEDAIGDLRMPFALISPGDATADPDDEQFMQHSIIVRVGHAVNRDRIGEASLLGVARPLGSTDSGGAGLLEIEEQLLKTIGDLRRLDGFTIDLRYSSAIEVSEDPDFGDVVDRQYQFSAMLTRDRHYPPALRFAFSTTFGPSWVCDVDGVTDRFDVNEYQVRYLAGSTAPADTTEGTLVSSTGSPPNGVLFGPISGTNSYSIFVGYDEDGDGVTDAWSGPASFTKAG